jgi:predicted esterase
MLNLKFYLLSLTCFLFFAENVFSQETGSFNDTISFNSQDRIISFYVPANYNPDSSYNLMVCLHGLGDNSSNYRNALVNSLNWKTYMPNTIFACPDGGSDRGRDFYSPSGDEEIISATINYVSGNYNIDTTKIILQGFSLGGRSALKYGLDFHEKFYGLLLNTPAIQGGEDAYNNPNAGVIYDYENSDKVKIAIVHGEDDYAYLFPIAIAYEQIVMNDGVVYRNTVEGMGHHIPSWTVMGKCLEFFDNPTPDSCDMEVLELEIPERTCNSEISPKCIVRNLGSETVTSFNISYKLNNDVQQYNWSGELSSFQVSEVELPELNLTEGINELEVFIENINNGNKDADTSDNGSTGYCKMLTRGNPLPFVEGFEGEEYPPEDWIINPSGNIFFWMRDNEVYKDGEWSLFMINTILLFYTYGTSEELLSPVIDLTSIANPSVSFDYAYNYHKYTPPYFTSDVYFIDTLDISVSTDCGNTFESIFRKGGEELATGDEPITNPLELYQCQFIPGEDEWGRIFLDLSQFAECENAVIKFSYISGQGGSINIDNVTFTDGSTIGIEEYFANSDFSIYPNPAFGKTVISYSIDSQSDITISVTDLLGNEIISMPQGKKEPGTHYVNLNADKLSCGLYFVRITGTKINLVEKLIIE